MNHRRWASPYLLWMTAFIVLPMGLIVYYAFTNGQGGFTLDQFARFFQEEYSLQIFVRSFSLALICTVICLLLGYPAAYLLASRHIKRSNLLLVLFLLPMWMNFLLRTYAWRLILEENGVIYRFLQIIGISNPPQMLNNQGAIVLGMVYNFLTFMILPIYTALTKTDPSVIEAAQDLGAAPMRVFRRITLPLSMPGVVSGITMVFMPAASTFVISQLLGGGKDMLIGDLIENQFMFTRDWNFGSAISIVLMIFILFSMRLVNGAAESGSKTKRRRRA